MVCIVVLSPRFYLGLRVVERLEPVYVEPQHDLVERQVGDEALQLRVFVAELFELPCLTGLQPP